MIEYEPFESNVIYIGTKTSINLLCLFYQFESNVIYIGTKTFVQVEVANGRLRVM